MRYRNSHRWNGRAAAGLAVLGILSGCAAQDAQAEPDPTTCHREADNVPLSQLKETINRMQKECGMPETGSRMTLTPEESRQSCERLKAGGYIDDVDSCISSSNGRWHQR
jgi:hypothetical protein